MRGIEICLYMRNEARSVMTNQFQITLPAEWRNAQGVGKGDKIFAHYSPDSVLIITSRKMSSPIPSDSYAARGDAVPILLPGVDLTDTLVDLLIRLPERGKTEELIQQLKAIIVALEA